MGYEKVTRNNKPKLEKRIMNTRKPREKSKSAGFTAILFTTVMITGCFLAACQPTPEEPVVQSKDKDLVQEVVQSQ